MKKYKIANMGCHEDNWFDIELSEEELKIVIKVFEENNKIANCGCTPHLYIYNYDNTDVSLNRDYDELNEESD